MKGLLLSFLLALAGAADALKTSGFSGHMMRFTGGYSLEETSFIQTRVFPPNAFERGFSFVFYFRTSFPSNLYTKEVGSKGCYLSFYSLKSGMGFPWFSPCDYEQGYIEMGNVVAGTDNSAFVAEPESRWQHFAFSFDSENKTSFLVNDAGLDSEKFMDFSASAKVNNDLLDKEYSRSRNEESHLLIGYNGVDGLVGEMDEFCVFSRGVTREEVSAIRERGCLKGAHSTAELVLHYAFDYVGEENYPLYDSVLGYQSGVIGYKAKNERGDVYDFANLNYYKLSYIGHAVGDEYVAALPSNAPLNSGKLWYRKVSGENISMQIPCDDCSHLQILTMPKNGSLYTCTGSNVNETGSENNCTTLSMHPNSNQSLIEVSCTLDNKTTLSSCSGTINYASHSSSTPTTDVVELAGYKNDGNYVTMSASIINNVAPVVTNIDVDMHPLQQKKLWIPHSQTQVKMFTSSLSESIVEITSLNMIHEEAFSISYCLDCISFSEEYEYEYEYESELGYHNLTVVNNENLPFKLLRPEDRHILLEHIDVTKTGESILEIGFRIFDGLEYSNEAFIKITVKPINSPPKAEDLPLSINEDNATLIDLSSLVSDAETDEFLIEIEELPQNGKLYLDGNSTEIQMLPEGGYLSQWVTDSEENRASQCWNANYCVSQIVGEPDLYPSVSDDIGAWQPRMVDGPIRLFLNFEEPVYAKQLTIFEIMGAGGVIRILGKGFGKKYETLWEGDERTEASCAYAKSKLKCAAYNIYDLCPKPYRISKIKIILEVNDENYWPAVDAVLLSGTKQAAQNIITDPMNRIWYRPNENFRGTDSFIFSAFDCPYYSKSARLKGPDTRRGKISINVTEIPDLPIIKPFPQDYSVLPESSLGLDVYIQDVDGLNEGHIIQITEIGESWIGVLYMKENAVEKQHLPFILHISDMATSLNNETLYLKLRFQAGKCNDNRDETFNFRITVKDSEFMDQAQSREYSITLACTQIPVELEIFEMSQHIFTLSLAMTASGMILTCAIAAWLFIRRKSIAVKLASGTLNYPIVFGASLIYISIPFSSQSASGSGHECTKLDLDILLASVASQQSKESKIRYCSEMSTQICSISTWLFSVGTTLFLSTLAIKAQRVDLILNNKKLKKTVITEREMWKLVMLYLILWIFALSLLDIIHPQELQLSVGPSIFSREKQMSIRSSQEICSSGDIDIHTIITIAWITALCVRTSYFVFKTRNITLPEVNDTKEVSTSIYTVIILGIVSYSASSILTQADESFYFRSIPLWIITTLALLALFGRKIYAYGLTRDTAPISQQNKTVSLTSANVTGSSVGSTSASSVFPDDTMTIDEKVEFYEAEIKRLKDLKNL